MRSRVLQNAHHNFTPLIGYAHNDWLERFSEFGIFGALAFFPFLVKILTLPFSTISHTVRILSFGALSFLLYSFVDFPSRTPACLLMFGLVSGLLIKYNYIIKNKHDI